ncbi:MAG TPA: glutaredoxin family protein [Nitriliruptorales bacterium]
MAITIGSGRRRHKVLVEFYTRDGCHLCDQAEELLADEARRVRVKRIDIDRDEGLLARYHIRVPVVVVDGREVAEGNIAPGAIRRAVRQARDSRWNEWRRA